jgi:uridine monophosphate synthetase
MNDAKRLDATIYDAAADAIFESGAFKDKSQSPGGKGFRLKLHEKNPDAPLSPYYLDLRVLQSVPPAFGATVELYQRMAERYMSNRHVHLLAPVPTAAVPTTSALAYSMKMPMVTPREAKTHGTESKIEGKFNKGQKVLLIEDLVTTGRSIADAARILRDGGLVVESALVLVSREQGGEKFLAKEDISLRLAFDVSELLLRYVCSGKIPQKLYEEIEQYRRREAERALA